ncbi:MAG: DUF2845 domain-containing protein [Sinobacteraceae bacterium]|nr:DUF2845 domain-containing protein [Nevskiaceae bacterium]
MTLSKGCSSALLLLLALSGSAAGDDVMRCGSRLVSRGMPTAEVRALCGEPAYRDAWYAALPYGGYAADIEVWYYNFGPSQLLRLLKFRNGELESIGADGYGFTPPPRPDCGPGDILPGMSKYRLLSSCGEPLSKRAEDLLVPVPPRSTEALGYGGGYYTPVYREEWIYNFGARYFLRKVILENGRVSEVRDGERGFDTP